MAFIVFEGLDGSGKSSLMKALEEELVRREIAFKRTREPGGTELGEEIRHLILRRDGAIPTARTELLLYQASRAQHVDEVIIPCLKKDIWVICDRFTASSLAFQAGGRHISNDKVHWLNHFATTGLLPDLTVLLDLTVEESKKRRVGRVTSTGEKEDRIESEADSFHERVRQSFLKQAHDHEKSWLVLDAHQTPEELRKKLFDALEKRKFF